MNCFNSNQSDIDFLIVIFDKINLEIKKQIIQLLLKIQMKIPHNFFEMSVVQEKDIVYPFFKYPTPFQLHFSPEHLEEIEQNLE